MWYLSECVNEAHHFLHLPTHTTLHPTAGLPATDGLSLKLSWVGPGLSLDGRSEAAGSVVGGPVGGNLSSGKK